MMSVRALLADERIEAQRARKERKGENNGREQT